MEQAKPIPVIRCAACGGLAIPPQYVCGKCRCSRFVPAEIPGRARVYSHTTIRVAPEAFRDQTPYTVAVMELAHDLRVTARVIQDKDVRVEVGQELLFDRLDEKEVYWFRAAR